MSKIFITTIMLFGTAFIASEAAQAHQRIPPVYPKDAAENCIEGFVNFRFLVNEDGWPEAFEVLESQPKGVFDEAVQSAVQRWRYSPRSAGEEVRETLEFVIEGECPLANTHNKAFNMDAGKAGTG